MVGIVLLGIFVLLLAFGAPIAVCLGMSSVGAILVQGAGKPLDAIMSVLPPVSYTHLTLPTMRNV